MPFEVDIYVNVMCLCDKQYCISPNSVVVVVFVFVFVLHCLGSLAGMILFLRLNTTSFQKKMLILHLDTIFLLHLSALFPMV